MTDISRSTSSLQMRPALAALLFAALRLKLVVEDSPRLPFPDEKQAAWEP